MLAKIARVSLLNYILVYSLNQSLVCVGVGSSAQLATDGFFALDTSSKEGTLNRQIVNLVTPNV